jgi:flagellar biosynthesis protein FlhG
MSDKELKIYFDILEISPDATVLEIRNAYIRLKKLYSSDSVVISPIADEFSKKERQRILQQVEDAYGKLMESFKDRPGIISNHRRPVAQGSESVEEGTERESYSGPKLKQLREEMGIQLFEVSLDTKIRMELLENIEQEKFDCLPPEVYLKGHLINFASYLLLDSKKVADDYVSRYRAWKQGKKENS